MADRTSTSTIERVCAATTSAADFHDKFVRTRRLCMLTSAQSGWRARHAWQPETLSATLGGATLRVDDRPAVTLTLAEYLAYADANDDERPLSIFDSEIVKSLAEDYTAPAIIEDGSLFADDPAPPTHRWFLVGAARTGTPLNTDPLATSAWNALVVGRKRWALFPPAAAGDASDDEKLLAASARLGAAEFFDAFVPLTLEPSWRGPRPLLLTQRAGETVFVPEGFRHAVLNEELAVAVTHNVAPPSAVERMLPLAADVCPAFAQRVEARRKKRRRGREVTIEGP